MKQFIQDNNLLYAKIYVEADSSSKFLVEYVQPQNGKLFVRSKNKTGIESGDSSLYNSITNEIIENRLYENTFNSLGEPLFTLPSNSTKVELRRLIKEQLMKSFPIPELEYEYSPEPYKIKYDMKRNKVLFNVGYDKIHCVFKDIYPKETDPLKLECAQLFFEAITLNMFNNDPYLANVCARWIYNNEVSKYVLINALPRDCLKTQFIQYLLNLKFWECLDEDKREKAVVSGRLSRPKELALFQADFDPKSQFNSYGRMTSLVVMDDSYVEGCSISDLHEHLKEIASGVSVTSKKKHQNNFIIDTDLQVLIIINTNSDTVGDKTNIFSSILKQYNKFDQSNRLEKMLFNVRLLKNNDTINFYDIRKKFLESHPELSQDRALEIMRSSEFEVLRLLDSYLRESLTLTDRSNDIDSHLKEKYSLCSLSNVLEDYRAEFTLVRERLSKLFVIENNHFDIQGFRDFLLDYDTIVTFEKQFKMKTNSPIYRVLFAYESGLYQFTEEGVKTKISSNILSYGFIGVLLREYNIKPVVDGIERPIDYLFSDRKQAIIMKRTFIGYGYDKYFSIESTDPKEKPISYFPENMPTPKAQEASVSHSHSDIFDINNFIDSTPEPEVTK